MFKILIFSYVVTIENLQDSEATKLIGKGAFMNLTRQWQKEISKEMGNFSR